ncbi:hypothetical protein WICPIJ_002236, partial [Wickerhamomyces pijperi]
VETWNTEITDVHMNLPLNDREHTRRRDDLDVVDCSVWMLWIVVLDVVDCSVGCCGL